MPRADRGLSSTRRVTHARLMHLCPIDASFLDRCNRRAHVASCEYARPSGDKSPKQGQRAIPARFPRPVPVRVLDNDSQSHHATIALLPRGKSELTTCRLDAREEDSRPNGHNHGARPPAVLVHLQTAAAHRSPGFSFLNGYLCALAALLTLQVRGNARFSS